MGIVHRRHSRSESQDGARPAAVGAMQAVDLRRQLYLILALRCMRTASFAQPVLVVWFGELGLSPAGVLWLGSMYSALVILAELPSGLISDRLGRRRTLHWAFIALAASLGAAAIADRAIWLLGFSQLFKAMGSALFSGTDMALLYETLKRYKAGADVKEEVLAVESVHIFAVATTEALFASFGGVLADTFGLQLTVVASIAPFLGSAVLALQLENDAQSQCADVTRRNGNKKTSTQMALWIPPKGLRWVFIGGVAINCGTYIAATALNPLLWASAGIPTLHFGWISGFNNVVSATSALLAPPLRRFVSSSVIGTAASSGSASTENTRQGEAVMERLILLLLAAAACGYTVLASASTSTSFPCFVGVAVGLSTEVTRAGLAVCGGLVLSAVRGLAWPLLGTAINGSVQDDSRRATTLSLFAGMIKVGMVCTSALLGALLKAEDNDPSLDNGLPGLEDARSKSGADLTASDVGLYTACTTCGTVLAALAGSGAIALATNSASAALPRARR